MASNIINNMVMYRKLSEDKQYTQEQQQQFFDIYRDLTRTYLGADFNDNYESLDYTLYLCIHYNLDNDRIEKVLDIMEIKRFNYEYNQLY